MKEFNSFIWLICTADLLVWHIVLEKLPATAVFNFHLNYLKVGGGGVKV